MRSSRSVTHAMRRECDLRGLGNPRGAPGGEGETEGVGVNPDGGEEAFLGSR